MAWDNDNGGFLMVSRLVGKEINCDGMFGAQCGFLVYNGQIFNETILCYRLCVVVKEHVNVTNVNVMTVILVIFVKNVYQ